MRKKLFKLDRLNIMIKEEIDKFINEVYDNPIPTKYKIINARNEDGYSYDIYRFKTNQGYSYDLDFLYSIVLTNRIMFKDNKELLTILNTNDKYLEYIDLGFTPTEIKDIEVDDEIIGTMDDPYIEKTNRNEHYELLNRIGYLINEYIKNNPNIMIYSIGKNTHENNLGSYIYIFNKIFSDKFKMFDVINKDYKYGSYFFIKNEILK